MKRTFDFTFALMSLVLLVPLLAVIAAAIKLGDKGPAIFSQTRIGQFGRPFRMYKFRTMVPQAELLGIQLTVGDDHRITKVGRWLRRTKLDELPQLWNVVKGEMSFVGPRPEVPRYVAFYTIEQRRVFEVRPGITDPVSLEFFNESAMLKHMQSPEAAYIKLVLPYKLAINLRYLRRRTVASDVFVMLATMWRLMRAAISQTTSVSDAYRAETHFDARKAA